MGVASHYTAVARLAARGRTRGARGSWSNGIWLPPGDYRVALTVDGRRREQPLRIVPDPRVKLPASAYAEQFALASEIDALRATVAAVVTESDKLLEKATEEAQKTRIRAPAGEPFSFGPITGPNVPAPMTTLRAMGDVADGGGAGAGGVEGRGRRRVTGGAVGRAQGAGARRANDGVRRPGRRRSARRRAVQMWPRANARGIASGGPVRPRRRPLQTRSGRVS